MIQTRVAHIHIPGVKSRRFLHISDAHLSRAYPEDTAEEIAFAEKQAVRWGTEGRKTWENFEDLMTLAGQMKPDALVMAGDCIDYYHPSCLRYLTEKLEETGVESLYVYGNHEGASYQYRVPDGRVQYPAYARLIGPDPAFWVREYGDLLVVGLDDSEREITERQMALFDRQMERGLPILLVIHVPLRTDGLLPLVRQHWGADGDRYFLLGNDQQSALTRAFCARVTAPDSPVAAILAGHVHFLSDCPFAPGKRQYTAAPGGAWDIRINTDTSRTADH